MIVVCKNNINRGNSWREKESNTKKTICWSNESFSKLIRPSFYYVKLHKRHKYQGKIDLLPFERDYDSDFIITNSTLKKTLHYKSSIKGKILNIKLRDTTFQLKDIRLDMHQSY